MIWEVTHEFLKRFKNEFFFEKGYTGIDTQELINRYTCKIHVYEPIPTFIYELESKFKDNSRVKIFPFAVDAENAKIKMNDGDGDASNMFGSDGKNKTEVEVKDIVEVIYKSMEMENKMEIDLLHINCEGCELGILERLIEFNGGDLLKKIKNIEVQFHPQDKYKELEAVSRYCRIQEHLSRTHFLTYHFHFVWENWKIF